MSRQTGIPPLSPSFIYSTGFPIPCSYGGAGESGKRDGVPPSRRSMMPPLSPRSQIPTTRHFSPGSGFSQSMSQPSPVSFRGSPSLPPLPSARGSGGSSALPSRKAHKRAKSDNIRGLHSPRLVYPRPIAMPVGVKSRREGESDEAVDVSEDEEEAEDEAVSNTTSGVKRRAGKEIAPSTKQCTSVSMDTSHNGNSPMLPPSPGNLFFGGGGVFTDSEMMKIVGSSKLRDLAASDPKHVKRILYNRESAARSKNKKVQHVSDLEGQLHTLETEVITMSTQYENLKRLKVELENENKELRIRLHGMELQAQLRDSLLEQLSGEIQRLKIGTNEVRQNLSNSDGSQSLDPNMFQNLNINQIPQPQTYHEFG